MDCIFFSGKQDLTFKWDTLGGGKCCFQVKMGFVQLCIHVCWDLKNAGSLESTKDILEPRATLSSWVFRQIIQLTWGPVRMTQNFVCFTTKCVNREPFLVQTIFYTRQNFSSITKLQRYHWEVLGAYNFFVRRQNPLFLDKYPSLYTYAANYSSLTQTRQRICGWVVRVLDLQSCSPGFESYSGHIC